VRGRAAAAAAGGALTAGAPCWRGGLGTGAALVWCRRRRQERHRGGRRAWRQALRSCEVNGCKDQAGRCSVCMHDAAGLWRACVQVAPVGWRGGMHVGGAGVCVTGRRHGAWPFTSLGVCAAGAVPDPMRCCYGGLYCPMWCSHRSSFWPPHPAPPTRTVTHM
jgi:hypothetical protein